MIESPWLQGRDRYERSLEGWTDNTHDHAFTHTVRIADDDSGFEVRAVCTSSPEYEIRYASARVLAGRADSSLAEAFGAIRGVRMVGGFTRRLTEAMGKRPGAELLVAAGLEIARLARQVAKLPAEATAGLRPGDARQYWELDTMGWPDLPNSCFTYTKAGRALFDVRPVTTPLPPSIYEAPTGAMDIFHRKKLIRFVQTGPRLHLFHSMHDNAHGFDVHYEIDAASGQIAAADSITSRLPYLGVCDEPQVKIGSMKGQAVEGALKRRIQTLLGGETGCTQLYDLTSDLLKLLAPE